MRLQTYITESEKDFWKGIYRNDKTHWLDKKPSNLVKSVVSRYKTLGDVLEIGCAGGIDTFELAKYSDSVIGIDIVPEAIKVAKNNLKEQNMEIRRKVSVEVGDAESLKYENNSFDFVYSLSVLHSTDPNKSLKEVHRVLKNNGNVVIYIFVGGKEGTDGNKFKEVAEKFFNIDREKDVDVKGDKGGDKHKALILFLSKKDI